MYESENVQEITLLDIVTSLLKKWKAIICVTLAGLLIGSALGLTLTLLGNRFYGARTVSVRTSLLSKATAKCSSSRVLTRNTKKTR